MYRALLCFLIIVTAAHAELVATSQLGYHPSGTKHVISYTTTSGTFQLIDTTTNTPVFTGALARPTDYNGVLVNCQGNVGCVTGDFSSYTTPGTYRVQTSFGGQSQPFIINTDVYQQLTPTLLEFYNALLQQHSSYHADMHAQVTPVFPAMADGSFIMEADQAALTTIRLGSAYRRNP
jgi:hypothetical protein